ncbi:MAG: hypothetical protein HUU20_11010 [Pirellulales bacterium]|nr:hypothetical protein [Pirellulales bacterium]
MLSLTAGDLDPTFGDNGLVLDQFLGPAFDRAQAVAIQSNGDILVAGNTSAGVSFGRGSDFALTRYHADGALDTTFGVAGRVTTEFTPNGNYMAGIVIQADGKIVVAGSGFNGATGEDLLIARYNVDGSLDGSFGDGGKIIADRNGTDDSLGAVAIQADGKIVVGGYSGVTVGGVTRPDFFLARYNTNGTLDGAFGSGGFVTTDLNGSTDVIGGLVIQPDGKIVAAGYTYRSGTFYDFGLARYNTDGSLDGTFGASGKVTKDLGGNYDFGDDVALQADGKIVVAGISTQPATARDFAVVRFNANGSLDDGSATDATAGDAFGSGGVALTDLGGYDEGLTDLALQADGKIVVVGYRSMAGVNIDVAMVRYDTDGSLDTTLDGDGILLTDLGLSEGAGGVAMQSDGKIVVSGWLTGAVTGNDFAVLRYNTDGSLDDGTPSDTTPGDAFDTGGIASTNFDGPVPSYGDSVVLQPDGKIVVAGYVDNPLLSSGEPHVILERYLSDGTLDPCFGSGGRVESAFSAYTSDIALASDGKIVVTGHFNGAGGADFAAARYNSDGTLDAGFGTDGIASTDLGGSFDDATAVVVQADGKVIVGGYTIQPGVANQFALVRYNADGTPDTDFGAGGIVTTSFGPGSATILGMALAADERIVVAGQYGLQAITARYNTNGSLDDGGLNDATPGDTFGTAGSVLIDFAASYSQTEAVTIQPDGKIVVAGLRNVSGYDFALARLNIDGSFDSGFGAGGVVTTDFDGALDYARDVAVAPDGKIVAVGTTWSGGTDDIAMARYNPDGSLDTTFGTGGRVVTDLPGWHDYAVGVVVQPDSNIVIAGYSYVADSRILVARYIGDPPPEVVSVDVGTDLRSVIVQLNDDDLDGPSAANSANYRLVASGGDGNGDGNPFNDGDEVVVGIDTARYDAASDQIKLRVSDVLFDDLFWLQIDGDDSTVDGTPGVTDLSGHYLAGGDFSAQLDLSSLTLIGNLLSKVESLGLSTGSESTLASKLEAVVRRLDMDVAKNFSVLALMDAFASGVERLYSRGEISQSDHDELLDDAELIRLGFFLLDQ